MSGSHRAPTYPRTRRVGAVAGVGNAIVDDPYQWLEQDTAEVLSWQAEQNQLARDHIRSWPHFDAVRRAVLPYAKFDWTPLTYHLVHRADLDLSQPHPVLAHAYGDGRALWLPMFLGQYRPFLEAGGVYAHANLRGGGEYGEDFFRAGTLAQKQHTFDDLHAIAEDMISKGITEARRIGVVGASAGGLLAGAAATQRPDLYGVSIARVPVLDLLRVVIDPYGLGAVRVLFGDPTTAEGVRHLSRFSPYHRVRAGTSYPAVLVECGESDHRCPAWHSRKTAARLQGSTSSEAPVLLRVWPGAGHESGVDIDTRGEQLAEWMSFAMRELNLAPTDVE